MVMRQFDVFTLTSTSESQCMPITESMAYGKAVIVSAFGGMPDFVEEGVTGLLVPILDVDALVLAMKRLADDPGLREEMGRRGRERFRQHYTPRSIADRIEGVYSTLIPGAVRSV